MSSPPELIRAALTVPPEPTLIVPPAMAVVLMARLLLLMFWKPPLSTSVALTVAPQMRSCVEELTPPPLMTSPCVVSPESR